MFVFLLLALSFIVRAEEPDAPAPKLADAEVKVRAMVRPSDSLPPEAYAGRAELRCTVRIGIDEKGVPYEAVPVTCDEAAARVAHDIGMRYRFYPVKQDGKRVKAGFELTISLKNPHPVAAPHEQGAAPAMSP